MRASVHPSIPAPLPDAGSAPEGRNGEGGKSALGDHELVHLFNGGDTDAFTEIVSRHRRRMFSVAYAILKNRADAEEIAQDIFIQAHRKLANFRCESSLSTWLHSIATNLSRNRYWYYFRRAHQATLSFDCPYSPDSTATLSELTAASDADPARAAIAREVSNLIDACIQLLTPRSREILVLRHTLNRTYQEIAEELQISVGTVKSRIFRARADLRSRLGETSPEYHPDTDPSAWFGSSAPTGSVVIL